MARNTGTYLLVLTVLLVASCTSEEVNLDDQTLGLQYFPLEAGDYRIYEVEKTQFLLNTGCVENAVTETYYIREVVLNAFTNLEGDDSYRISRQSRVSPADLWQDDSVWTARLDRNRAVLVENNIPFIKLSFPLQEGRQWNGNSLNAREEDMYLMTGVYKPFSVQVGDLEFPKTVTVVQEDFDDLIVFKDQRKEVYAEGVGLVYKERLVVEYDSENNACIGERIRNAGTELRMHLIEYGGD